MKKFLTIFCLVFLGTNSFSDEPPPDGIYETFYENGQLEEQGTYKDGKKHGLFETFYSTGIKASMGNYMNGQQDGLWGYFYENGQLEKKGTVKDGKAEGLFEWYDDEGRLLSAFNYEKGKVHGPYKAFHKNGQLKIKGTYKDNKKEDLEEVYDKEGNLRVQGSYINDEKDGIWYFYKTPFFGDKLSTNIAGAVLTRNIDPGKSFALSAIEIDRKKYYLLGKEVRKNKYFKQRPNEKVKQEAESVEINNED